MTTPVAAGVRIIGIDPGLANVGYGVIQHDRNRSCLLAAGTITTASTMETAQRLKMIHDGLAAVIETWQPSVAALEDLFFCTNVRTAISVAQGRGACILATANSQIELAEYTPLQIKMAVTGYGRATKQQVEKMVRVVLAQQEGAWSNHAADALAVALCHAHSMHFKVLATAAGAPLPARGKRKWR